MVVDCSGFILSLKHMTLKLDSRNNMAHEVKSIRKCGDGGQTAWVLILLLPLASQASDLTFLYLSSPFFKKGDKIFMEMS